MTTTKLSLVLLGEPREVQARKVPDGTSAITAKPLKRYKFSLTASSHQQMDSLTDELSTAQSVDDVFTGNSSRHRNGGGITDTGGCQWHVLDYRLTSQTGELYAYTVEIEECEQLRLHSVRIDSISLHPEKWIIDRTLRNPEFLHLLTTVTPEQGAKLEAFMELNWPTKDERNYFPVEWIGVRETATQMRFEMCKWRRLDDSSVKYHIELVSAEGDDGFVSNTRRTAIANKTVMTDMKLDRLIDSLQSLKVLDNEAVKNILNVTPTFGSFRELDRDEYLEEYFD